MGNKLCKKKADAVDNNPKSPTPFDRIITRLHLRPNSWKSESHLDKKEVNRYEVNAKNSKNENKQLRPLSNSKSSDWTEASLEVPDNEDTIHLRNPKLTLIFNDDSTPVPPPRKHKKGFREKLESVAKNSFHAFQSKKPVDEPLFTKTTINYICPLDDHDHAHHNRDHKHDKQNTPKSLRKIDKQNKRRKNLSVVSLPNYSELKFSIANTDDLDKKSEENNLYNSALSLPGESKKLSTASTGKLETYMTRCRSFGSLLPQQLLDKLRVSKAPADVESDDSFGGLEDWDLRIIEHYNPRDTSLPRPRKPMKNENEMISDIESLIVKDDSDKRPVPPIRRSESLLKKLTREASESAAKRKSNEVIDIPKGNKDTGNDTPLSITPPPSPEPTVEDKFSRIPVSKLPNENEVGNVEHSSLMKILEEFSIRDKQMENERLQRNSEEARRKYVDEKETRMNSNFSSLTPSLVEFEKTITNTVEDFINAEKACIMKDKELHFTKYGNGNVPLTVELTKT